MKRTININKILKKSVATLLIFILLLTTITPAIQTPFSPKKAEASNTCSANGGSSNSQLSARVGGVALDQAATFLADMDDITGAYYDDTLDRIVFVGKKNTSLPEFDKDDLAVAIKAVIFNKTIPAVSIENPTNGIAEVLYYGGIENTNFGQLLFEADYKMKQYVLGHDTNGAHVSSTVSGYKSVTERYLDKNPTVGLHNRGRQWITPKDMVLKRDENTDSFVFDNVSMELNYEPLQVNDPLFDEASEEFAAHHSQYFDSFAQEMPEYLEIKQLGKIVSIIKWLSDNGVATDFHWANDYAPEVVETPTNVQELQGSSPNYNGYSYTVSGGVEYLTENSYLPDNGTSSSLKAASELVDAPKEDIHWNFTKDGQEYESVAVAADAFRSMGAYSTASTDMAFPTNGDDNLLFQRSYSSFSGGQQGIGRGWSFMPAQMNDNQPLASGWSVNYCDAGDTYYKRNKLAFQSSDGVYETFSYDSTICSYVSDDSAYHSKITTTKVTNQKVLYTVTLTDQTQYVFEELYPLSLNPNKLKLIELKDKNGNTVAYNYDSSNRLSAITDGNNHTVTINYNSSDLISSVVDWSGKTTSYTYDAQGNLLTVTDPKGGITTYTYDANYKLTSITDRDGKLTETNTYTPEAKIATSKDAGNVTKTYSYDDTNRVITQTDNLGRVEKTSYDSKARTTKFEDPASNSIEYTYGSEFAPLTVKDKNGNITTNTYDSNGNLTSITYPNSKTVTYEYDNKNRITKVIDGRYGSPAKETINTYDANGNLTQIDESGRVSSYTYNSAGEMLTLVNPLNRTTTWTRDNLGNKLTEVDPESNTSTYEYDAIGRLVEESDPDNKSITYTYDNNGNILTRTDAIGTITYQYNGENVLKKTTLPDTSATELTLNNANSVISVTDALNNVTDYNYDSYQNMTSKQDALNRTTEYVYDQLNRRKELTTPLGKVTKWDYDANGNIVKRTDANNTETIYEYDVLNRLKKITYPSSVTVNYTYDDRGNLLTMVDATGTTTYEYDKYDRLTQATDSNNEEVNYEYDSANNLTKIIYPGNKSVIYAYDDANRLTSITDWNNEEITYEYNDNGTIQSRTLPNGIATDYVYDNANRLIDITHRKSSTTLTKFAYERNNVGNIKVATESSSTASDSSPTATPTQGQQQNDHVIYADALGSGWESWSWGSTNNFSDTSNPHSGSNNLSWTVNSGYAGLYLHKNGNINTTGYTHFTFALKSTQANQNVQAQLWDENGNTIGPPVSMSNYGGQPISSGYTIYSIPLADIGGTDKLISGILLQDISGSAQPAMYVDSMSLKAAQNNQPTATPTPSSTPPSTTYVYEDALASGWGNWSWGSTVDTNNTTNVYEGTKSLSWTVNSGYAALYLHKDGGIDTDGYTHLTFALKATQANQTSQVQLWDENDATIGSPLNLNNYGGQPVNNEYTVYSIPLTDLGGSDRTINGLMIQDVSGTSQPAMFVDSVGFIAEQQQQGGGSGGQTETTYDVYDEGDANNWDGGSWGSTTNFAATIAPHSGSQHISWTVDSGYAALHFYDPAGVDTTDYETLDFALQATQTGTNIAVYMTDDQNNPIGTEANLSNHGGAPTVGTYKEYSIPLSALNAENRVIKTIVVQDKSGGAQSAVYADTLKLVGTVSSGSATTTLTKGYTYDLLGRVLAGDYQDNDYSYTYDNVGNMLTSTKNNQTSTSTYNNDNQLTAKASESFIYDNNGNQTARGSKTLTYNLENKLTSYADPTTAKTVSYTYDGNGERIEEKVNSTDTKQYVNDVSGDLTNVLVEKDLVNNTQNYFIYGAGIVGKGGVNNVDRYYYLEDGVGNIRFVADANGDIVKEYDYDPYGNLIEGSEQDFLFKGEQLNSDTGLYYMRARYYDPATGRFISKDPVEGDKALPESQNGYSYTHNNPINLSDPSGECNGLPPGYSVACNCVVSGVNLAKSLASKQQVGEAGKAIAGQGSAIFRDAAKVAEQYGGQAADWVKKTSSAYEAVDGTKFQTHWVENIKTGVQVLFKTKFE